MSMEKQRKYDREFKLNYLKLYSESGIKMEEVAWNPGIPLVYPSWMDSRFKEYGEDSFFGNGHLKTLQ